MPDWVNFVAVLFAGVGGLTGMAALWNAKTAARKEDLNALVLIVAALQSENERLVTRVGTLEDQNKTLREANKTLRLRVRQLEEVMATHNLSLNDSS